MFKDNIEVLASPEGGPIVEVPCIVYPMETCYYVILVFMGYDPEGNKIYRPVGEYRELGMKNINMRAN